MTVLFADSSALVKLYVDEASSDALRRVERRRPFIAGGLARVEVPAAFWRKVRIGELDPSDARLLTKEFEVDWYGVSDDAVRFSVVAVSSALVADAARLCEIHDLKGADAVQLASALAVQRESAGDFACYDQRLTRAAEAEGLRPIAPA